MASIRPFERADLPAVAALMEARLPGWRQDESFLAKTFVDHPWADPELPSLVAIEEPGEVLGFVGVQVRRLRIDERPARAVCLSNLVVAADRRVGVAGTLLLRRAISGPQDLSWSDFTTETVVRWWRMLGGHVDYPRSHDWMLVLHPVRWVGAMLSAGARGQARGSGLAPVRALPAQAAGRRLVPRAFPPLPTGVDGEPATAALIAEHLPTIARDIRLRVDYDEAQLDHLFAHIEASADPLVRRLVRRGGDPIGWYAYLRRPHGVCRVLHLSAPAAETDAVVGELIEHTRAQGAAVLSGRAEPHLHEPLRRRLAVLGFAGQAVTHSRDPEIHALLTTSSSLLTYLDGEWAGA